MFPNDPEERSEEWVTCWQVDNKNGPKKLVAVESFWDHIKSDHQSDHDGDPPNKPPKSPMKLFHFVYPKDQEPLHDALLITDSAVVAQKSESPKNSNTFYIIPSIEDKSHFSRVCSKIASSEVVFVIDPSDQQRGRDIIKCKKCFFTDIADMERALLNWKSSMHEIHDVLVDKFKCLLAYGQKRFILFSSLRSGCEEEDSLMNMLFTCHDLGLLFFQGCSPDVQDPLVFTKPGYLYEILSKAASLADEPRPVTLLRFIGRYSAKFSDLYEVEKQLSQLLTQLHITIMLNKELEPEPLFVHTLPLMSSHDISQKRRHFFCEPLCLTVIPSGHVSNDIYWLLINNLSKKFDQKYKSSSNNCYKRHYSCLRCGPGSYLHVYMEGSYASYIEVAYEQQKCQEKSKVHWPQRMFEKLSTAKAAIESSLPDEKLRIGFPCPNHPGTIAELQEMDECLTLECTEMECSNSDSVIEWKKRIWYHKPDGTVQVRN